MKKSFSNILKFSLSSIPIFSIISLSVNSNNINYYSNKINIYENTLNNISKKINFEYDKDIINKSLNKNTIDYSGAANIYHFEQSYHETPNEVTNGPKSNIEFSYNPYTINNDTEIENVNNLLTILNNNQLKNTLKYHISSYYLSVDRKFVGVVVLVPMYASGFGFNRNDVDFYDEPSIVFNSVDSNILNQTVDNHDYGLIKYKKFESDKFLFKGKSNSTFSDTDTRTSCEGPTCSHNVIDWVQMVTGGILRLVVGDVTDGVGSVMIPGAISSIIIPSVVGGVVGSITGSVTATGGLTGNGSGKCSTLSSTINVRNDDNLVSLNRKEQVGVINNFDFSKLFEFKNVLHYSNNNNVWTKQNLTFGFNDKIIESVKFLSDYKKIYNGIKLNFDKLNTITRGKFSSYFNKITDLIFGRKAEPYIISELINNIYSTSEMYNDSSFFFNYIDELYENATELEIFKYYKECGFSIPNDYEEWDFIYDVALPNYLSNDILCDVEYADGSKETIKLWDKKDGFQNINIKSLNNKNENKTIFSNIRFNSLKENTYSGLNLENFFPKQDNINLVNDSIEYKILYRENAKNYDETNLNDKNDYIELNLNKFLYSNSNPSNGVVDKNTGQIINLEEIKNILDTTIQVNNDILFSEVLPIEVGKDKFINWNEAKNYFRINGTNGWNDYKKPVNDDVCYVPNIAKGYLYTILKINNFNFYENTNYIDGDFSIWLKDKISNSNSLFKLETNNKDNNQYFLARLKTNRTPKISSLNIIDENKTRENIKNIILDENNWEISKWERDGKIHTEYTWKDTTKDMFTILFDSLKIDADNLIDAMETIESSSINTISSVDIVTKTRIGYDIDENDNIDYSKPIYEYKLNNMFDLSYDENIDNFVLSSKEKKNFELNMDIAELSNFSKEFYNIDNFPRVKYESNCFITKNTNNNNNKNNKWALYVAMLTGVPLLSLMFYFIYLLCKKKKLENKKSNK